MIKRIICIAFTVALMLSIAAVAYAATDGYNMSYLPGTDDKVTNMPDNDSGTGEQPYIVSSAVPQREGYEFLSWKLDYEVIPLNTSYTVRYLEEGTNIALAPDKSVGNQSVGTTPIEDAIDILGYDLVSETPMGLTLELDPEENVITFYYKQQLASQLVSYTIRYLDITTMLPIVDDNLVAGVPLGVSVTEYPILFDGYIPLQDFITWNVQDNDVQTFYYFPFNHEVG